MAVRLRATFFFKDSNGYGWTETIHSQKPDLTSIMAAAKDLIVPRRNMLGNTAYLVFIRVSDDLVKRDSLIYQVPAGDQQSRGSPEGSADIANTSLVVRLQSNPTVRRTLFMRGVPDGIVTQSGKYTPSGAFDQAFTDWLALLQTGQWACRTKDNAVLPHVITNVVQDLATTNTTITTLDNHGLTVQDPVTITGVRGAKEVNGTWPLFSVPTPTSVIIKVPRIVSPYGGGGLLAKIGFLLFPIVDGEVRRVSHRIAGRPFDSPVGRRKARRHA